MKLVKLAEFSVLQSTVELTVRLLSSYRSDHERSEEGDRGDDDDDDNNGWMIDEWVGGMFDVYVCRCACCMSMAPDLQSECHLR